MAAELHIGHVGVTSGYQYTSASKETDAPSHSFVTERALLYNTNAFLVPRYFDWANMWRMGEFISYARILRMDRLRMPIPVVRDNAQSLFDTFETSVRLYVRELTLLAEIDIPTVSIEPTSPPYEIGIRAIAGSASPDGAIAIYWVDMMVANTNSPEAGLTSGGEEFECMARAKIAHEVYHVDQTAEVMAIADDIVFQQIGVQPSDIDPTIRRASYILELSGEKFEGEYAAYKTVYSNALMKASHDLTDKTWTLTAGDVRHLEAIDLVEREAKAHIVATLTEYPTAQTFEITDPKVIQMAESRSVVVPEGDAKVLGIRTIGVGAVLNDDKGQQVMVGRIPSPLLDPSRYENRFLNPSFKDFPFLAAYRAANSRTVLGTFRGVMVAGGILCVADIGTAVASISDPNEDGFDVVLNSTVAVGSTVSAGLATAAMISSKFAPLLPVASILGSAATFTLGTKHTYDDLRDSRITSTSEKVFSITEMAGGVAGITGAVLLLVGSGGTLPVILLIGGAGLAISSQAGHSESEENRVARNVAEAIRSQDFAKLNKLVKDERAEFDDDTAVDLFEDYLIPQNLLTSRLWDRPEMGPLRKKLIAELSGEGFLAYMGDEEATYRLFVALHESGEEASRATEEMDSSDKEAFYAFCAKHCSKP